jgi:hypothetical protein
MSLRVTNISSGSCDSATNPTTCTVALSGTFKLAAFIDNVPAGTPNGYYTVQDQFVWPCSPSSSCGLSPVYKGPVAPATDPTGDINPAKVCGALVLGVITPPVADNPAVPGDDSTGGIIQTSCTSGTIIAPAADTFKGIYVSHPFTCSATDSSTVVQMPLLDADNGSGTGFVLPDGVTLVGFSDSVTINCGAAAGPTATPTSTTQAGPTNTPTITNTPGGPTDTPAPPTSTFTPAPPTATRTPVTPTSTRTPTAKLLGDVDDDGDVDSIDALLVLEVDARLLDEGDLANADSADVNHDGVINSIDALYILWADAGLREL